MFRFHHISIDKVYGDLDGMDEVFTENIPYWSSSLYFASKAFSVRLLRAWHRTCGLLVVVTNYSNNYGFYNLYEKLIPVYG